MQTQRVLHLAAIGAIALAAVLCHLPALNSPFFSDDNDLVLQNPSMKEGRRLLHYFSPTYWQESHGPLASPYRPVREILLGSVRRLKSPPDPRLFHAVNLAGHVVNATLVYLLALSILARRDAAFLAGMVFALHPAHIEVLGWIKNVGEIACVLFALLAILAYRRAMQYLAENRATRFWLWDALAVMSFLAALLTKESAASVPLVLTMWIVLDTRCKARRRALLGTIPLWVVMIAYAVLQAASHEIALRNARASLVITGGFIGRSLLVSRTLLHYLRILVFPVRHVPWHDFTLRADGPFWATAAVCAAVAGIAVLWLWAARRWRTGALAIFWTIAAMGPAANIIVNTERPLAEQRLYFPSVGFALLIGALAVPLARRPRLRIPLWTACGVLCLLYAALQLHGLRDWRTERTLWARSIRMAPAQPAPHNNLGHAYLKRGAYSLAVTQFRRQIALDPTWSRSYVNLGVALGRMGRAREALNVLEQAARRFPDSPDIRNALGTTCLRQSQFLKQRGNQAQSRQWLLKAQTHFEAMQRLKPDSAYACLNLGNCDFLRNDYAAAQALYEKALAIDPEFALAYYNLGRVYSMQEQWQPAATNFERALRFQPAMLDARVNLAIAYERLGRDTDAARVAPHTPPQ